VALIPELSLLHPEAGVRILEQVFGFHPDAGLLRLGSQALRVRQASGAEGHGRIDHIALAVPDIDAALQGLQARGATLDMAVTPDGIGEIAEFWDGGIRYVYLSGPEGARIELCQRHRSAVVQPGHDHIGIPCTDIDAMQRFFEAQGARLEAAVDLDRPGGRIPVRFLAFAGGLVELYQPGGAERPHGGLWSRLLAGGMSAEVAGPDGLILAPL
jgi:catechol 2,3-dioxygenase-like lactoylglutathione lyase family enzyme